MSEATVTLSLKEYERLKVIADKFSKAFDEKKTILILSSSHVGMGYIEKELCIVNESEQFNIMNEELKIARKDRDEYYKLYYELRNSIDNKKSWFK